MNANFYFLQGMIKIVLAAIFFLVAALISVYLPEAMAEDQVGKISCQTPASNYIMAITHNQVSFYKEENNSGKRSIASAIPVNTTKTASGFTKTFHFENKRFMVHVENRKSFSEIRDYLSIRSAEGHEMTYPLICQ